MRTLIVRSFILGLLALTVATCAVKAQTNDIMFTSAASFVAGNTIFPAGTYTIRQAQDDLSVWQISSDSKSASAYLLTEPIDVSAPAKSELTFNKYGEQLILKRILVSGNVTAYIVQTSYTERKAAKAGKPTKVAVPAQKK
jgi:hypothetical protein